MAEERGSDRRHLGATPPKAFSRMAQTHMQKAQAPLREEYDHDLQEIHEKINHDYELKL
jgi:hypothetical protein